MKTSDLTPEQRIELATELADDMMGGNSFGHTSLIQGTQLRRGFDVEDLLDWNQALSFCQEESIDIDECPCCGWVSEGNFYPHPYYEGVCDECQEGEE